MARLGEILVAQNAVAYDTLEQAAPHARGRLGDWLRTHGLVRADALAHAVATQHSLPSTDLRAATAELFRPAQLAHYQQHGYAPIALANGILTIACTDPSPQLRAEVMRVSGYAVAMQVASHRDLQRYLLERGALASSRTARLGLRRRFPDLTADRTLHRHQALGLGLLVATLLGLFLWDMQASWHWLMIGCNLFYFVALAFKLQLYEQGLMGHRQLRKLEKQLTAEIAATPDDFWPTYSILVPMYRESHDVMQRLLGHLQALDYPKEKLDIKLIIEADDAQTHDALIALAPPPTMEIIRVPVSSPRTKPKACNVALQHIRGEFLVIFDAEDAPHPQQLKFAARLFRNEKDDLACLQARLNYYNRNENLLTQCFALEYSTLFRLLLPALERMQLPIPLGGTSNHLRVAALQAAGGWDAFNVTEDADLGIRLAYLGYRTRVLPSQTMEESPVTLGAWMRQRTRWIKGYIQTWLVYMRDPAELKRRLGTRAYYGFQFFVGAPALTFLLAPILWSVFIIAPLGLLPTRLSPFMLTLCLISFVGGVASHVLFARTVLRLERWRGMGNTALFVFPFYWLLHSLACARALWQLARAPHYWEKTTHGVSRVFGTPKAR